MKALATLAACLAAFVTLTAGTASAATFAAIAFSQANGATGWWNRASSQDRAEEGALQECGPSCEIVIWARDACAVLAVGKGYGYGVYWSSSEDAAVAGAMRICGENTTGCELQVMTCSGY